MEYLFKQGCLESYRKITPPAAKIQNTKDAHILCKREIDAFFGVIEREYENLEYGFRKRVCLRDKVMMELLFFHGIEISELLRLEISDYHVKTGLLNIRGKRGKVRQEYLFSTNHEGLSQPIMKIRGADSTTVLASCLDL